MLLALGSKRQDLTLAPEDKGSKKTSGARSKVRS